MGGREVNEVRHQTIERVDLGRKKKSKFSRKSRKKKHRVRSNKVVPDVESESDIQGLDSINSPSKDRKDVDMLTGVDLGGPSSPGPPSYLKRIQTISSTSSDSATNAEDSKAAAVIQDNWRRKANIRRKAANFLLARIRGK